MRTARSRSLCPKRTTRTISICGGQTAQINNVTNYPGFAVINGFELSENMKAQAKNAGAEIKREEVVSVELEQNIKVVNTHKATYQAKNIIIRLAANL